MKLFSKNETLVEPGTLFSITDGDVFDVTDVNDEMFSQKIMGDGVAFQSTSGKIYAPCKGYVSALFPTMHAIGITSNKGVEILIHIGINTVNEKGAGFQSHVKEGDKIKVGQRLITFNQEQLLEKGYDLSIPMIITNMDIVDKYLNKGIGKKDIVLKYLLK